MEAITRGDILNANNVKAEIMQALVDEGYLTLAKAKEFHEQYAVIIAEPSWFESVYTAVFPERKKGSYYNVVKFIGKRKNCNKEDIEEDSLAELKFQLAKAESDEDYDLAKKLKDKILKIEKK